MSVCLFHFIWIVKKKSCWQSTPGIRNIEANKLRFLFSCYCFVFFIFQKFVFRIIFSSNKNKLKQWTTITSPKRHNSTIFHLRDNLHRNNIITTKTKDINNVTNLFFFFLSSETLFAVNIIFCLFGVKNFNSKFYDDIKNARLLKFSWMLRTFGWLVILKCVRRWTLFNDKIKKFKNLNR